jgi:hypothetical protein
MELPVGVVFRRLDSAPEAVWFELRDLTAGGTGLLGTAVVRWVGSGVVELCAVSVSGAAVGDRLLREVADALRADGAERVVATLPGGRELLLRAGFARASDGGFALDL